MPDQATLSIGALAQATSVPVNTLRTWERRHGFPKSVRLPSGHRRFHADQIVLIRWIIRALEAGYRPSALEALQVEGLRSLVSAAQPTQTGVSGAGELHLDDWLDYVDGLDSEGLSSALTRAWGQVGALEFLDRYITTFLTQIGHGWADGRFSIAQEHAASACILDFLSNRWRELSHGTNGPTVVLGTLQGERHALGLHQVAVLAALHGLKVHFVGADTPAPGLAAAAARLRAHALLVSISIASPTQRSLELLEELRTHMPDGMELVVGGRGAPNTCPEHIETLGEFDAWARAVSAYGGTGH